MSEREELEVDEVVLEKVPASEYTSRKNDNHLVHFTGEDDETFIQVSKAVYNHLKGVLK